MHDKKKNRQNKHTRAVFFSLSSSRPLRMERKNTMHFLAGRTIQRDRAKNLPVIFLKLFFLCPFSRFENGQACNLCVKCVRLVRLYRLK